MTNKHEGSKEHKDHQRTRILIFIAHWASEMFSYSGIEFDENLLLLETLKQVYIESDWANDRDQRMDVIQLFSQLEDLFNGMGKFTPEDYRELDLLILKLTA